MVLTLKEEGEKKEEDPNESQEKLNTRFACYNYLVSVTILQK